MYALIADLLDVLPDATYYKRQVQPYLHGPGPMFVLPALLQKQCNNKHCDLSWSQDSMVQWFNHGLEPAYLACLVILASMQGFPLKKIAAYAANRGFSDLLVFNEDRKSVNGLLLVHLPDGPTAHFKLSNLVLSKNIKVSCLTSNLNSWHLCRSRIFSWLLTCWRLPPETVLLGLAISAQAWLKLSLRCQGGDSEVKTTRHMHNSRWGVVNLFFRIA